MVSEVVLLRECYGQEMVINELREREPLGVLVGFLLL